MGSYGGPLLGSVGGGVQEGVYKTLLRWGGNEAMFGYTLTFSIY